MNTDIPVNYQHFDPAEVPYLLLYVNSELKFKLELFEDLEELCRRAAGLSLGRTEYVIIQGDIVKGLDFRIRVIENELTNSSIHEIDSGIEVLPPDQLRSLIEANQL